MATGKMQTADLQTRPADQQQGKMLLLTLTLILTPMLTVNLTLTLSKNPYTDSNPLPVHRSGLTKRRRAGRRVSAGDSSSGLSSNISWPKCCNIDLCKKTSG